MLTTSGPGFGASWTDTAKSIFSPAASVVKQTAVSKATTAFRQNTMVQKAQAARGKVAAFIAPASASSATHATSMVADAPTAKGAAKRLQAALLVLGKIAKSPSLSAIKVDGAIGAKTATAVNLAFTKHLGPGQAPAQYRTGKMPLAYIKTNANTLAGYIEAEIQRRGGTPISSGVVTKAALTKAIKSAPAAAPVASKDVAKRLQLALVTLGKMTGSKPLLAVKVDGALGAKTAAAVNWAFTHHIGPGQAAAQYRTGNLPLDYIKGNASVLASMIEAETKRRGGKVVTKVGASKKLKTKNGKLVTATKVETDSGETYEVTDSSGHTYFTADPTNPPPPEPPEGLPEPSEEQNAVAAEASAAAATPARKPVVSPKQVPSDDAAEADAADSSTSLTPAAKAAMQTTLPSEGGGESFLSTYKWPIIGGVAALTAIGVGVVVMKKRKNKGMVR
jgi:hypothetical protein